MNFELTEEQKLLQSNARKLMAAEIDPVVAKNGEENPLPPETIKALLKKLAPLGYLGGVISEQYGGAGLDWVSYGALVEVLNPALGFPVVAGTNVLAYTLSLFGSEKQKETFLPRLLSGDILACLGATEPDVGSNLAEIKTTAVRNGGDWILNGTKMWITHGTIADLVLVIASVDRSKGSKGLCAFLVERARSPFKSRQIETMGLRHDPIAELVFEDCRVSEENVLGTPGKGLSAALAGIQAARCLLVGFGAFALARRALEASVRYAKDRKQFGKPIGSHQLIQEMIADMAMEVDIIRLLLYRALAKIDEGGRPVIETSMAKLYSTEAAFRVASKAVQIHGACGLSKEFPVERYFRDARMYTIPDGSSEIQKLVIAREILGLQAFA